MKKRLVLLLVTAMAATTVLAGCGSKDSGSSDNGKKSSKEAKVENDDYTLIVDLMLLSRHMDIKTTAENMLDSTSILHRRYVTETTGNW